MQTEYSKKLKKLIDSGDQITILRLNGLMQARQWKEVALLNRDTALQEVYERIENKAFLELCEYVKSRNLME